MQRTAVLPVTAAWLVTADGTRLPFDVEAGIEDDFDYETIYPGPNAVKPDTRWVWTDLAGHEHRWADDVVTDTVKRYVHVPCDGSCGLRDCDGWGWPVWECSLCGAQVRPRWIPDATPKTIFRGMSTTVTVDVAALHPPVDGVITLRSGSAADSIDVVAVEYTDDGVGYRMPFVGTFYVSGSMTLSAERPGMWVRITGDRDPDSVGPPEVVAPSPA